MVTVSTKHTGDLEKEILRIERNIPNLLDEIAQTIAQDNIDNVNNQRSFDGSALKPLSAKYKEWKSKHLGYTDIFKGRELKLIKAIRVRKAGKDKRQVYIEKGRDEVMTYLEQSGRRGWGIGDRLKAKLKAIEDKYLGR